MRRAAASTSLAMWVEKIDDALAGLLQQDLAEAAARLDVQARGGLVHDEDRRRGQESAGDAHPLAHAARVVAHLAAGVLGEADGGEQALDLRPPLLWVVHPPFQGPMIEELLGGEAWVGVELLRQEADPHAGTRPGFPGLMAMPR